MKMKILPLLLATVAALADRAQVSQATVVRLAHALGYSGFPDLRITLTQELARREMELERATVGHGRIDLADELSDVVAKLAFHEARSIEQTARLIDPAALEQVSAAFALGRRPTPERPGGNDFSRNVSSYCRPF